MEEQMNAGYKGGGGTKGEERKLTSLQFSIDNHRPGSLVDALLPFKNRNIDLTQVTTREAPDSHLASAITVFADLDGHIEDPQVQEALADLKRVTIHCSLLRSCKIPWYATSIKQLDLFSKQTLAAGAELTSDHPGFNDPVYRDRRNHLAKLAETYKHGQPLPKVDYTADEIKTWSLVWDKLNELYPTHACKEYLYNFSLMVENCGYRPDRIPQLQDISEYLRYRTGFTMRPVTGLLSPRDFLNALAFRVFHSTQYIRHSSRPFYTPEPDVIHELMGHAVMFADPDFADFTQSIGLASLGAPDDAIEQLASCYWFSVEFGLCKQGGQPRAYGAGLLGSFGELKYCLSGPGDGTEENGPEYLPWEPEVAAKTPYPITTMQPRYFVADSFKDATKKMQEFAETFDRPFTLEYNPYTHTVKTITKNTESYMRGTS